jgi:hypothetical protein
MLANSVLSLDEINWSDTITPKVSEEISNVQIESDYTIRCSHAPMFLSY